MAPQQESRSFSAQHERGAGSVLKVVEGGYSGFQYSLDIDTPQAGAQVRDKDGVTVLLDPKSVLYLSGTALDYRNDLMQSAFVFNNPNVKRTCGCGKTRTLTTAGLISMF